MILTSDSIVLKVGVGNGDEYPCRVIQIHHLGSENVEDVFRDLNLTYVDLMKIDIEGAECELLNRMMDTHLVSRVRYFQIRFYENNDLRNPVRTRLEETHAEREEFWEQKLYTGITDDPHTYVPDVWEYLLAKHNIKSVLDVGCGTGNNLRWFFDHGCDVIGVDGVPRLIEYNKLPRENVLLHDYRMGPLVFDRQFDLCWSSEFVEHVQERYLANFLASFKACKRIVITHAWPGQGGLLHFNEQPTEYWVEKMKEIGFTWDEEETKYLRSTWKGEPYGRQTLTSFAVGG